MFKNGYLVLYCGVASATPSRGVLLGAFSYGGRSAIIPTPPHLLRPTSHATRIQVETNLIMFTRLTARPHLDNELREK